MRSIREYIKASLSDSSHILYTNTHSVPRGVVDFTFIRAPVKRIADVLSKGFPSGEHVYDLTPRWRVADCSRGVPFAHINGARREFPPAVEAHALHGACDAFEFYINVAPSDSGMKSYVQLASFWRGNGGAGLDVNIMPDTCFEAFVFLEGVRSAGVFPAGALPVSFGFEGYVDVDERGIATSYNGVFDRLKARGVPIPVADAVLIDYERGAGRVAQACGRVELRRVPFFSGLQCFVWTTSLGCAIGGYNLSFRYGAPNPTNPGFWDIL